MLLNEIFQKIYVINLERRRDRRITIERKLHVMNIQYEIINAVDGYDRKYDCVCDTILNRSGTWIKSRGAVGLILTYMKILEDALNNNYDNILIFEDDICFHKNFNELLEKSQKNINFNEADVVWLGANQYRYDEQQKTQLADPNCEYYTVSRKKWHYTFGTYAIAMSNKMMRTLRTSIDLDTIIYGIDVHIFWVLADNEMVGRVLRPFLILPDVSDSDNMGVRDQLEFSKERLYDLEDYKYISIAKINEFKDMLGKHKISLRQMFDHKTVGSHKLTREEFNDGISGLINVDEKVITDLKTIGQQFFDYFGDTLNLRDIFECIEEKKSFVCVVPSYNNIDNYKINLDSIRKQIYPYYQYRIIYVDDLSDDGTSEAVQAYIKEHKLENQIQYIKVDIRQRQSMARFMAFHKCFDDEIVLNVDGDDWLFNELALERLYDHYTENDILVSYGSYYMYDEPNIQTGQQLGIPYNNKVYNMRQYPDEVKSKKTFRYFAWICGHLRSAYAKLFKTIEIKHMIGPDGYFLRMSSDISEMYPVLEMAQNRHLNIKKPVYVYNKVNSLQFATSYYNMNEKENEENKTYRDTVDKMVRSRPYYPRDKWDKTLIIDNLKISCKTATTVTDMIPEELGEIDCDYLYIIYDSEDHCTDIDEIDVSGIQFLKSKPALICSFNIHEIDIKDHEGAVIKVNDNLCYIVKKLGKLCDGVSIFLQPGLYDKKKLIDNITKENPDESEIQLIPFYHSDFVENKTEPAKTPIQMNKTKSDTSIIEENEAENKAENEAKE